MSRNDRQLLSDIRAAISAIQRHLSGGSLDSELVLDAVRMRLIEVGEATKGLSDAAKSLAPNLPWREIAGMRDRLAHRYFENELDIIKSTVDNDLVEFLAAVKKISRAQE